MVSKKVNTTGLDGGPCILSRDGKVPTDNLPLGSVGPPGPQGDTGSQGIPGDMGSQGDQGIKGDAGDQGAKGDKGDTGDTGGIGPEGPPGDQGLPGDQGVKGDTGDQGLQGNPGIGVPAGGTTGQVLSKKTNGDYDTEWKASGGGGEAFPTGSVFMAVVATNPNTLLGYGTWVQIAGGKFLVGQTGGDADFDVAEEIGGAKTHTHSTHTTGNARSGNGASGIIDASHNSPSHLPPYFVVYIWKRTT